MHAIARAPAARPILPFASRPRRAPWTRATRPALVAALGALLGVPPLGAQRGAGPDRTRDAQPAGAALPGTPTLSLDSLIAEAEARNPELRASSARVIAARARIAPAGALPDPTLMAGVVNVPTSRPSLRDDEMTMTMVGFGQTLPFAGKRGLRRRAAERERDAAAAGVERVRREVVRRVRDAYYELAYLDRALEFAERQRAVLTDVIRTTEARFASGGTGQQDVLTARMEAARLGETTSALLEARRAEAAELVALLGREDAVTVGPATVPEPLARAAVADSAAAIRFTAQTLGARAADSPLPPLEELQAVAVRSNSELREHEAMIAAQAARVELARREVRPDVDVSLQYGQRLGRPDVVTAQVGLPLPVRRGQRQHQQMAEASAELTALEAEHHASVVALRADVARLVGDAERARTQLALAKKAVLPQGQAAVAAAAAAYQAGRTDLRPVLEARAALLAYETAYYRALSDFAKAVAALEQVVGAEVLR